MATRMTRKLAVSTVLAYAKDNGFDDEEVIEVVEKVLDSFSRKPSSKPVNKTRVANEVRANALYDLAPEGESFDFHFVINALNDPEVATPQKVTGIMKVGIDLGLFTKSKDKKATVYTKVC